MPPLQTLLERLMPLRQWERLRHPWAGWARIALIILLPFVVWTHDILLICLWIVAAFSHPWWFPAYHGSGRDAPLMTRLVDVWRVWADTASPRAKTFAIFPCLVPALPLLCALWAHLLFWSIYFYAAAVLAKALFLYKLMLKQKGEDPDA